MGKEVESEISSCIEVSALHFAYESQNPIFANFNLKISPGSRCLLVGANGSGKTTLLKILAGKHMVGGRDVVRVLNGSAFHDTQLVCSGDLAYLGGSWNKTVGSAGEVPLQGDFSAEHMIFGVEGVDPVRREKLIDLLDIDLQWRMHKVSDGQRRRVQICMGLLHPFQGELWGKEGWVFDKMEREKGNHEFHVKEKENRFSEGRLIITWVLVQGRRRRRKGELSWVASVVYFIHQIVKL
ncbi:ABC transporter I family member 19-like isoform X2 [Magnolia sinica]|uniref:ABC transporter I family member 19-like isoform X2 n=1 Tax=Magnolia sinica TaxID=86752 RepID=UPI002658AC3A|nr:ABC transporter I family member 19-like isoform X2 [Magnolia sinica]